MKICHISSFYPPIVFGGAEIYVKRLAERMARDNDVLVITLNDEFSRIVEEVNGVKVYRVHPCNIYPLPKTKNMNSILRLIWNVLDTFNVHSYGILKKILEREKPDIVHVHHFKGLTFAFKAVKDLGIPLVHTVHNYYLGCPVEHLFERGRVCKNRNFLCKLYSSYNRIRCKPDVVTAPTNFVLKVIKEMGFFRDVPTVRIPLGVDLRDATRVTRENSKELLFVGRATPFKGLDVLLKAVDGIDVILNVAGGVKRERRGNVVYHGFVSEEELWELYKRSSVLIVPSVWYEVFGLVIVEAFKFGLPVVGSDIGGIPELIVDGYNGYLFEPGNPIDLREKILKVLDERNLKRMSFNAYRSAKKYDMDAHVQKLYKVYSRLT